MRHLNEIVRERNQYSRDAMEAWQDFINLKGRMDTELSKVTKRNNFLVEELETWKQQFLKFQAFAEQLTKETSELKVKIEGHKRENRRLTGLIDQHKDDVSRLTLRLSGTEKQRDDALEALVLQQEIAEELERERKRNQQELSSLQQSRATLSRQRDDAQRVVLHLRGLIDGQTQHMETLVRSIGPEEVSEAGDEESETSEADSKRKPREVFADAKSNMSDMTPELEQYLLNLDKDQRQIARLSITDVADRYLRDKTDSISDIIRNIGEQCAAAVEGLHMAQDAEDEEAAESGKPTQNRASTASTSSTYDGPDRRSTQGSDIGDDNSLHPDNRTSSIPPTPDLIHNRSSTSMSMNSTSTYPERLSQQYNIGEVPTRIVEDDDEHAYEDGGEHTEPGTVSKQGSQDILRRNATRLAA